MSAPARQAVPRAELARDLQLPHAGAIVVGTIIGSGIFLVPTEMMQAVGSAGMVYLVWVVGGLLSFFGALTYAELGAMKPQAGGEYVYVRDAYGPLPGFLYAWTWFLIAKPASVYNLRPDELPLLRRGKTLRTAEPRAGPRSCARAGLEEVP